MALGAVMRAPFMRLALPFIVGIAASMWWPIDKKVLVAGIAIITVVWVLVTEWRSPRMRRWRSTPFVILWCALFGMLWQQVRDPLSRPMHAQVDGAGMIFRTVRVTAINGITDKVIRADADVLAARTDSGSNPRLGEVMVTLMRRSDRSDPVKGDRLLIRSRLEPITRIPDPGGFDRRSWAASRGMYHETFVGQDGWIVLDHHTEWTDLFEGVRQRVSGWLVESGLPVRERALVKALVLGLRDELDGDQRNAFVRSGTIHVLAVSGTHVGFIYAMLLFIFRWWGGGWKARFGRGLFILLALWGYAGLTGAHPSVLRATIMFSLFTVAGMSSRRAEPLNSLFAAALVLLLWDPHMLIEIGFQLSFLAVLGIILFLGPIERLWVPNNKWIGHIWTLTAMSISAQLLTTPLSVYLFRAFPIWFLPANLFVVTAAAFAVYGAFGLLLLYRIPILGPLVVSLLAFLLMCVDRVTTFFAGLPGAYPALRINTVEMILLYLLVAFMSIWLMLKWRPAKLLSLSTVAVLLISWALHVHQKEDLVTFTVYDDRQALQASMSVGREHVVLGAAADTSNAWLDEKVDRHQRYAGFKRSAFSNDEVLFGSVVSREGNTLLGAGRWVAPHLVVRFLDPRTEHTTSKDPACDVLVIQGVHFITKEDLDGSASQAQQVVLAGGLKWRMREFVRRWCSERNIPCHDVRDQGAFIVERRAA